MTEMTVLFGLFPELWPLEPEMASQLDRLQEAVLLKINCHTITFGEWKLVDHDDDSDEEGIDHPPYQLYERLATGLKDD